MELEDLIGTEFLYSQDLSNYKTNRLKQLIVEAFLYSQDLSNYKTVTRSAMQNT